MALVAFCVAVASAAILVAAEAPSPAPSKKSLSPVDLIVTAQHVLTMDPSDRVFSPGAVAISGGKIVAVGSPGDLLARYLPKHRISRPSAVVLPGLVNTHTHAAMCLLRGIADDRPLMEWLQKAIFPAEAKNVSPEFVRAGTSLACLEMVRGGTTTFADMYYYESDVAAAVDACGMRAVLGETWLDVPAPGHASLAESQKVTRAFLEKWKGHARITAAVAPHAPYTCSKETLLAAKALADEYGAPLLIHVSETRDEQKQILERTGTTPVKWLDEIGFLSPRVLAAHGVWLGEEELAILAARKVSLSHNPESNMKLASGVAPVVAARKAGVTVGLGTDGVAGSNNDLDMWEAMDFAGKLAKVTALDPTVLPARDLLRMATTDGAKALGLETVTGSLEPGKAADLIAVDLTAPRTRPVYDVTSALVYSAKESDVSLTVVDGRVLWDGRTWRTGDVRAVLAAAAAWRDRIRSSLREAAAK
ncbi:MAG TPA: amidohydrolase [Thermoanaerobaculia bacterium]|nr:amidohydrolase [Thermoanaerobaculia bacterium]